MVTPSNSEPRGSKQPVGVHSQPASEVSLKRLASPLADLLTRAANGENIASDGRETILQTVLARGSAAQRERAELFHTLEELLADNLRRAGGSSLDPSPNRTGLLNLAASLISAETIWDMEPAQHERWVLTAARETARLTCVDHWESDHTQQLEFTLEMLSELLFFEEEPRVLSTQVRERVVVNVARFLGKVESDLFRGVQALELAAALTSLYQIGGLLREPTFAERLEALSFSTLSLCHYLTPDCFGDSWREAELLRAQDGVTEDGASDSDDMSSVLEGSSAVDRPQHVAAELLYDVLTSFRLSGGRGQEDFWTTMVQSISPNTKTLGSALLGLATCSADCLQRALEPLLKDAATEPLALLHIVNLMCASELYDESSCLPCDKLLQELAKDVLTPKDREALRQTEAIMFEQFGQLLDDPFLAYRKLSMLQ